MIVESAAAGGYAYGGGDGGYRNDAPSVETAPTTSEMRP